MSLDDEDPKYFRDDLTPDEQDYLDKARQTTMTTLRTALMHFTNIMPGDLITINFPPTINQQQLYLAAEQGRILAKAYDINILLLTDGITMNHVPADQMKEYGWIRDPEFKPAPKGPLN